jgi:hypothetical protein
MFDLTTGQAISFDVTRNGELVRREGTVDRVRQVGMRQLVTLAQPNRPERPYGNYYMDEVRNVRFA